MSCERCPQTPIRTFTDSRGAKKCDICPIGKEPNEEQTRCIFPQWKTKHACRDLGMYLDDTGGYENKEQWQCIECPIGAECIKTASTLSGGLKPKEGWKRLSWDKTSFGLCPVAIACVPANDNEEGNASLYDSASQASDSRRNMNKNNSGSCMQGHQGELCALCEMNFARPLGGDLCQECPESEYTTMLLALAALTGTAIFSFLVFFKLLFIPAG